MNRLDHYLNSLTWNGLRDRYVADSSWLNWLLNAGLITQEAHCEGQGHLYSAYIAAMCDE